MFYFTIYYFFLLFFFFFQAEDGIRDYKVTGVQTCALPILGLDHVEVDATLDEGLPGVRVRAAAKAVGRTGVEMEALTAVSVALLTGYDMVKAADRGVEIETVRLLGKTGGTRGDWRGEPAGLR